jgi:hypothetical protein
VGVHPLMSYIQDEPIEDLNTCDVLQRLEEVCGQSSLFVGHMGMKQFLELA